MGLGVCAAACLVDEGTEIVVAVVVVALCHVGCDVRCVIPGPPVGEGIAAVFNH